MDWKKNEHFTYGRKKRWGEKSNKRNAGVRKRLPTKSTSAFCSDDAVEEKDKNRKKKGE